MRKLFANFFNSLAKRFEEKEEVISLIPQQEEIVKPIEPEKFHTVETKKETKKQTDDVAVKKKTKKKETKKILDFDPRDIMEAMGVPFLALSKNRKAPIVYESPDGTTKIRISCHSEHYVASIYDWDIIQCIAGKIQEVINSKKDIPPRTVIIQRHALIKELHKHNGKTNQKKIEESLKRLQTTLIATTVRNEDYRYKGGFGFIDNWGYTERKDIKEFRITLSDWLYDGICIEGALLKVCNEYFDITSGLKKILYRIARKHVGTQNHSWDFSLETLYEKSGSEQELKKFKYKLKKAIEDDDLPGYRLEWIEENSKITIRFINIRKEAKEILTSSPMIDSPRNL
jgi:plasmid replication initiation protein